MQRRLEIVALGFSAFCIFTLACSSGTGLISGGAGNHKKAEKKDSSLDAKTTGNENNRPAQEDSSIEQAEEDDSDLSVIPPEVVSAAYLTCTTKQTGTEPELAQIHLGCTITKENGEAFPKNTAHQQWGLKDSDGADIDYTDIALPADSQFHKIYGLQRTTYDSGVDPVVAIEASDKSVIPVKKKGVVRISGKIVE